MQVSRIRSGSTDTRVHDRAQAKRKRHNRKITSPERNLIRFYRTLSQSVHLHIHKCTTPIKIDAGYNRAFKSTSIRSRLGTSMAMARIHGYGYERPFSVVTHRSMFGCMCAWLEVAGEEWISISSAIVDVISLLFVMTGRMDSKK